MLVRAIDGRFLGSSALFLHRKRTAGSERAPGLDIESAGPRHRARFSLCRGPALSMSSPGALVALSLSLSVSGPSARPALSVSGPGALRVGPRPVPLLRSATHLLRGPPAPSCVPPIRLGAFPSFFLGENPKPYCSGKNQMWKDVLIVKNVYPMFIHPEP